MKTRIPLANAHAETYAMPERSGLVATPILFFFFCLESVAGLLSRMPMLMPMPVCSSLVVNPFCPLFFFFFKAKAAYHHPYAYAYVHAHGHAVRSGLVPCSFFSLLGEWGGLTHAHAL